MKAKTTAEQPAAELKDIRAYIELEIDLGGLRGDISYTMRQKHYTETVKALAVALDDATEELEQLDGRRVAEDSGLGIYANQFARNAQ